MKTNLVDLINGNLIAKNLLNSVTTKKGEISSHYLKIQAGKAYKDAVNDENFSFSSLQNFCRNVNEKDIENLTDKDGCKITDEKFNVDCLKYLQRLTTWLKLKSLNLTNDEILFSHISTYGTEKELNTKYGTKKVISLNLFLTCLERYNTNKIVLTVPEQIETTKIEAAAETNLNVGEAAAETEKAAAEAASAEAAEKRRAAALKAAATRAANKAAEAAKLAA